MLQPFVGGTHLRARLASLTIALIAVFACAPEPSRPEGDPAPAPPVQDGELSQVARIQVSDTLFFSRTEDIWERFDSPFVYTNFRADSLYHPTCRPNGVGAPTVNLGLQRLVDGGWMDVWSPTLPACLSEPIVISPGGRFLDTLNVYLHPQDTLHQPLFNPTVDIDGTYRVVWRDLLRSYDPTNYPFGEPIDLWERQSTTFELRRH
jgi:hypothetical protein